MNVASRIAEYARPGEVLVSEAVVDASAGADMSFADIGLVELKCSPTPFISTPHIGHDHRVPTLAVHTFKKGARDHT